MRLLFIEHASSRPARPLCKDLIGKTNETGVSPARFLVSPGAEGWYQWYFRECIGRVDGRTFKKTKVIFILVLLGTAGLILFFSFLFLATTS